MISQTRGNSVEHPALIPQVLATSHASLLLLFSNIELKSYPSHQDTPRHGRGRQSPAAAPLRHSRLASWSGPTSPTTGFAPNCLRLGRWSEHICGRQPWISLSAPPVAMSERHDRQSFRKLSSREQSVLSRFRSEYLQAL